MLLVNRPHAALFAAAVWAVAACTPEPVGVPSPSASAPPSVQPTASSSPASPTAEPTPTVGPSPTAEIPGTSIRAPGLGQLTGNWIFAGKLVPNRLGTAAEAQVWAIPLDGGQPKLAVGFPVPTAGIPEAIFDNQPYLRRQFSPDGRRMVVNAYGELAIVDLVSGRITRLGVSGFFPAWSKDGSRIAFLHFLPVGQYVPPDLAIAVMPAAGGTATDLMNVGGERQSVEWSPDGSMLVVSQPEHAVILDASNGRVVRTFSARASYSAGFAHWRSSTPQIALAAAACQEGSTASTSIVSLERATAPERVLVDSHAPCPTVVFHDPRWNPANGNELLYVTTRSAPGVMPEEYRPHVLDVASGKDTALPITDAYEATWTWDGAQIAYVTATPGPGTGNALRLWRRDGSAKRELLQATGNDRIFSVASVSY